MGFALTVNAHHNLKGVSIATYLSRTPSTREYITTAIKRLQEANELIAKKHGSDAVRQQNLKDIQTFNAYLEKMDTSKDHQKES